MVTRNRPGGTARRLHHADQHAKGAAPDRSTPRGGGTDGSGPHDRHPTDQNLTTAVGVRYRLATRTTSPLLGACTIMPPPR